MAQQLGSFEKVLRVGEGRRLKRLAEQAAYIGTLEPEFEQLSDAELAGKTVEFRQRIDNGEPVSELVFEAFAEAKDLFEGSELLSHSYKGSGSAPVHPRGAERGEVAT